VDAIGVALPEPFTETHFSGAASYDKVGVPRWKGEPLQTQRNFIAGKWVESAATATIEVIDPSRVEVVGIIPEGAASDVDAAVGAAATAAASWAATPVGERASILRDNADNLADHIDEIASIQSSEMGQPIKLSRDFVTESVRDLAYFADIGVEELTEPITLESATGNSDFVVREPYGVAALIVPWNFPVAMTLAPLAGLLIGGNTVVLKPSERSPLSTIRLIELLDLPPGVLNLVLGDRHSGEPLAGHVDVDFVCFTGSVESGRTVAVASAQKLRPSLLELGGKDPGIVDAGVDARWAAERIAEAAFMNTGQICTSVERVYVHRDIAEDFTRELVALAEAENVGDAMDETTTIGPLVDERQRDIVNSHVLAAVASGARVLAGGEIPKRRGFFYPPTVIVDVADDMKLMTDETFGPIAPIRVVDSFDEALQLAKATQYGLAATVLTKDEEHAAAAVREIPAGIVWINEWQAYAPGAEFEPAKSSGVGHTGDRAFVKSSTRPKFVHMASPR
jgi:acyl-CoA reductase-like NAD-dependent aldehyde dehydrogenase